MAKKKKTKKQKIITDKRRELSKNSLSSQNSQIDKFDSPVSSSIQASVKKTSPEASRVKKTASEYAYLMKDLRKTAILTSSIIALQIILFLALTNKLLTLPGLSY